MEDIKNTSVDMAEEIKNEEKQTDATEQKEPETKPYEFDYEKLASLVSGKQNITEDTVLKGYFKQKGLSAEEMEQAITSFKSQKAEKTPDIGAIQSEAQANLKRALNSEAQKEAMLMASEIGVDVQAMPYLVRMMNLEDVTASGSIDKDKLKAGLEDIVSAMPQLKQSTAQGGFQKVGADPTESAQSADDEAIARAFGVKK